ncbi:MAG TPA: TadE/TadG family type IV pilus assembly protein [Pirellulales bacterium]|nr:TadE/TadG family type IV pilus assembly protein [Pirellulales bacterium]
MLQAVIHASIPWLLLMAVSVAAAWWLTRISGARPQLGRLKQLHADQRGAVQSLSFVMVLPLFIMIMLFIVQLSQVLIATIVVHYAAFAAARSAIVWVPARLEPYDPLHDFDFETSGPYLRENQVGPLLTVAGAAPGGTVERIGSPTPKLERIKMAAVLACLPICPSRNVGAAAGQTHPAIDIVERLYRGLAPAAAANPYVNVRLRNKLAYSLAATTVEASFLHRADEPPLGPYLVRETIGPDQRRFYVWEVGWQDPITVKVTHQFAMLPGPGRFLSRRVASPGGATDALAGRIGQRGGLYVYPISATATLGNEGEKSVLPYVQTY